MNTDEYRYLTFLFCDLVDSTTLSQALDHEDWRYVLGQFRKSCLNQVQAQGGITHECQGDGFLFYFGFPVAQEDSAMRALRAAWAIIDDCRYHLTETARLLERFNLPPLQVRASMHSGNVVIGKIEGQDTATGFPLAYTVRLHERAEPNTLVISEETRGLIQNDCALKDKGFSKLKGIDYPVRCYEVTSLQSRQTGGNWQNFVGRHAQINTIQSEWSHALAGCGRAVLISGEAGIGKSRLLSEVVQRITTSNTCVLSWCCLSHTRSIALKPILQGLENIVNSRIADTSASSHYSLLNVQVVEKLLRALLSEDPQGKESVTQVALRKSGASVGQLGPVSEKQKRTLLKQLQTWILELSQQHPVLLIVEDVHWIDPSSLEFLGQLASQLSDAAVLLLMTYREETAETWHCGFPVVSVPLTRLSMEQCRTLLMSMPGAESLDEYAVARLVERSDGVPLFIEESAAMMIESEYDDDTSVEKIKSEGKWQQVPFRLMDLLTARLDRTGEARQTAGLAASIGREFDSDLLKAVSGLEPAEVDKHLNILCVKGLINPVKNHQAVFQFKHELVRDAAYGMLLKSTRRDYHYSIAVTLDSCEDILSKASPEILAHHYTEAHVLDKAIECWLIAARNARFSSNPVESRDHYLQVKKLLSQSGDNTSQITMEQELEMLTGLGSCLLSLDGYGSDGAKVCFEAAESLAKRLNKPNKVMRIRFGLEAYYFMRGDFKRALEISENCLESANEQLKKLGRNQNRQQTAKARLSMAQACWALGNVHFHRGDFCQSIPLLKQCVGLYEYTQNTEIALVHNPDVMSQLYIAWYECETGKLDLALLSVETIVENARRVEHLYSVCVALAFNACIHFFRGEYRSAIEKADESIRISDSLGFVTWLAWSKVLMGRCLCEFASSRTEGLREIKSGLKIWKKSGAIVTRPFALTLLAESLLLNGDRLDAEKSLRKASQTMQQFGERYYEAEIYRLQGVLSRGKGLLDEAAHYFEDSIAVASHRGFNRTALRSAFLLLKLQPDNQQNPSALTSLNQARSGIHGGYDTHDVQIADEVLANTACNDYVVCA